MTAIIHQKWSKTILPKRILVIRLQAMGDVIITLPYIQSLRNQLPRDTIIDFLTRDETADIPQDIDLFNKVYVIKGKRNFKKHVLYTLLLIPKLFLRKYDVIIDLQNNKISHLATAFLFPKAWTLFDKFSPVFAGTRNKNTIDALGFVESSIDHDIHFKQKSFPETVIENFSITKPFIIINPAGFFETRNWQTDNYVTLCRIIQEKLPQITFVVLGVGLIEEKALILQKELGKENCINLVGKTTPSEAFAIVKKARMVVSEDSGLLHFAFAVGTPTLAILGSTPSYWMNSGLPNAYFLDSSDLECGNCFQPTCKRGDIHCLTRYTPAFVAEKVFDLLNKTN
ncbi:MAG: glycosyltransferase family 9 protein [Raineya sp.]|nr:glycosyltransferase family 9 protein [Raineya sp.]